MAQTIIWQVCSALKYLHVNMKMVHRDVKPSVRQIFSLFHLLTHFFAECTHFQPRAVFSEVK